MAREKKPHLKQRKDGRYVCFYHDIPFYGATEDEAFEKRKLYKASIQSGISGFSPLSDYAVPWLKRSYPSVADSTYAGLAIHLQHLLDCIGRKKICEIVPSDIKDVYSKKYKGYSISYISSAKQLYCALFDSALADGLCRYNPARDKAAKPHKGKKPKERVLTQQERKWIETLCTDHRAWPVVMTMLYAGVRPQEAKAIDIDRDVDFEKNIITVRETAHVDGQKYSYTDEMKTDWSGRQIPLFPPLRAALKGKHGYLITSAHGERVTIQTFKTAWKSYLFNMETAINGMQKRWYLKTKEHKKILAEAEKLRKAGSKKEAEIKAGEIPAWIEFDIVPYTLRHAFCQMCRDTGVELNTCRRWMGHADTKMILKVYDAVSDDRSDQERKKVENQWIDVQKDVQNKKTGSETVDP